MTPAIKTTDMQDCFSLLGPKMTSPLRIGSRRAHKKNLLVYHILENMTADNLPTYLALKDLQSLTKTDLKLIQHSLQEKFKCHNIFWEL